MLQRNVREFIAIFFLKLNKLSYSWLEFWPQFVQYVKHEHIDIFCNSNIVTQFKIVTHEITKQIFIIFLDHIKV